MSSFGSHKREIKDKKGMDFVVLDGLKPFIDGMLRCL